MSWGPGEVAVGARRVLYVEDSPADRALVQEALRTTDLRVTLEPVGDGEAALERIRAAPPDLVLLDLRLPRLDGVEVVQRIRADDDPEVRRTPVVLLSASTAPADIGRAYDCGANGFLTKPMGFQEFSTAIASVISLWLEVLTGPPRRML
jgi:chemotaxis family two-component system response regulator Rcp1